MSSFGRPPPLPLEWWRHLWTAPNKDNFKDCLVAHESDKNNTRHVFSSQFCLYTVLIEVKRASDFFAKRVFSCGQIRSLMVFIRLGKILLSEKIRRCRRLGLSCPLGALTLRGPSLRLRETSVGLRFVIRFFSHKQFHFQSLSSTLFLSRGCRASSKSKLG